MERVWHNLDLGRPRLLQGHHSLSELLARARRRFIRHLLLDRSALALAIGMGGLILLLLIGTQVLDWYWVVLLALASLGVGVYRLRKTIPSGYEVAQGIDRKLSLADTLSTAAYFSRPDANGNPAVREVQRREAEELARTVDLREGIPFRRSRYAYPALGLALVAFGLFAVRYAVTGSLSLQPSLLRIAYDTFFGTNPLAANRPLRPDLKQPQIDPGSPDAPLNPDELSPDSPRDSADNPDPDYAQGNDAQSKADQDQNGDQAENADRSDSGDQADRDNQNGKDDKQDGKDGKQDPKPGNDGSNSSLMDKLRDALSNLLNKMKPNDKEQSGQNQQKGQQNKSQNSQNQKGQQQKKSDQDSASDDQQQGDSGDKNQSAEANGSERATDKTSPENAKSGIGSEDGEKSAREAAELAAMGKISEILGKRAQNVTGEVMVEVGTSKQQLKTPLSQRQASHVEAGSEINRDEVPLIYQQFVQQYFEEIRKTPASKSEPQSSPKP
jgi:hypothetical protein